VLWSPPVLPSRFGMERIPRVDTASRWLLWTAAVQLFICASAVAAEPVRTVRFRYQRGAGAETCPDESALRRSVAARLGYDPFGDAAEGALHVRIEQREQGLGAHVTLLDRDDAVLGERSLVSAAADCGELAEAVVLAISLAVEPLTSVPKPVTPPEAPPEPPAPPPPPPPAPADREEPSTPAIVQAGAGAHLSVASQPEVSSGLDVEGRIRWPLLSLGIEGHAELPVRAAIPGGEMTTSLMAAGVSACLHTGGFAGCGVAVGGIFRVSGKGLDDAQRATVPYAAVGARASFELPVTSGLSLRASLDLTAPLTRATALVSGREVWSTPPVSGQLGLSVLARF